LIILVGGDASQTTGGFNGGAGTGKGYGVDNGYGGGGASDVRQGGGVAYYPTNRGDASGGGGGGGGGSSYAERKATNVHFWQGWKSPERNGLVVISW
jgi:hypothetical protein